MVGVSESKVMTTDTTQCAFMAALQPTAATNSPRERQNGQAITEAENCGRMDLGGSARHSEGMHLSRDTCTCHSL